MTVLVFVDTVLLAWHDPDEMTAAFPAIMWFWVPFGIASGDGRIHVHVRRPVHGSRPAAPRRTGGLARHSLRHCRWFSIHAVDSFGPATSSNWAAIPMNFKYWRRAIFNACRLPRCLCSSWRRSMASFQVAVRPGLSF